VLEQHHLRYCLMQIYFLRAASAFELLYLNYQFYQKIGLCFLGGKAGLIYIESEKIDQKCCANY